jgi:hypothetical protein
VVGEGEGEGDGAIITEAHYVWKQLNETHQNL